MPVESNALPLTLDRLLSEQPPANELKLSLDRTLGELPSNDTVVKVTANALPLPLTRPLSDQPPANALPFSLSRPLGTLGGGNNDDSGGGTAEPPPEPRRMQGVAGWFDASVTTAKTVRDCVSDTHNGIVIANRYQSTSDTVQGVVGCQYLPSLGFVALSNCARSILSEMHTLSYCQRSYYANFSHLADCTKVKTSTTVGYVSCKSVYSEAVVNYRHCDSLPLQPVITYQNSFSYAKASASIAKQQTSTVQAAVPVPCRYYPIPEPPPSKPSFSCRPRPPANALPLKLYRKRTQQPASVLPLTLACWHDELPPVIPSLRSYLVHNTITATVGGIAVDPLGFGIKSDMDSYCWQGNLEITASDYDKIKHKLDVPRGDEPLITVTINGFTFAIIAEEQARSRQFANNTYQLSGRSVTARLGADYAVAQAGLLTQDNYASQIANQQLANLPFSITEWSIPDWLVPANEYSVTGKTPIAVIADIAQVAGGFVMSDANGTGLSLKLRWKASAWNVATTTPDLMVPADVIHKIDDKKRTNPCYNTVTVMSNVAGGHVYRQLEGRDREAPTQNHALYTDRDVIIAAGQAALSDSGTHGDYTLKLPWADKYNIPLATLGDIWQIGDPEGSWRGVVTGVSVSIEKNNDAPCVYQTVSIDRYLDN